ncbi:MAG: 3-oxoacyl-[acyl-carrier-protein] reductase [Actinobacteria bacterium]|nr:3-oxoacyl-[acyl-carrier-protein] reductase [Actinomycetota bacterium]
MLLKDKICLVTGGSRGIGAAIAGVFVENGALVAVCDVSDEDMAAKSGELANPRFYRTDVSNEDDVKGLFDKMITDYGRVDVLVNNAGINRDGFLLRMSEEDWDKVIDVNLKGSFLCSKHATRLMIRQNSGSIINISSVVGITGNVGQANYSASKAGLIGLTKSLAREFASRSIRVNAIAPGFIKTVMTERVPDEIKTGYLDRIPLKRFGEPLEVANVVLFLASDLSSYVTGQVIIVDGGMAA